MLFLLVLFCAPFAFLAILLLGAHFFFWPLLVLGVLWIVYVIVRGRSAG